MALRRLKLASTLKDLVHKESAVNDKSSKVISNYTSKYDKLRLKIFFSITVSTLDDPFRCVVLLYVLYLFMQLIKTKVDLLDLIHSDLQLEASFRLAFSQHAWITQVSFVTTICFQLQIKKKINIFAPLMKMSVVLFFDLNHRDKWIFKLEYFFIIK